MSVKSLLKKIRDIEDRVENLEHDAENLHNGLRDARMQLEELTDLSPDKLQELIDEKDEDSN